MSQLFMKILNLSLYAALLIPVVMLLRVLFQKAPKWICCLFWALVAVRLLCPVTIESPFSLLPATEKLPTAHYSAVESGEAQVAGETGTESVDVPAETAPVQLADANSDAGSASGRISERASGGASGIATGRSTGAGKADPIRILAVIWLAGFCVMMGQALFSFLRLKHSVSASVRVRSNVRICDEIRYPFILGIIRPMIYLPGFLEGGMKRFVLAHERAHLNRHDHWWKPLGFFLLAVHWFNPLCWIAYILFCRDLEMACDERVIRNMDRESKADYSQTLLLLSSPASRIAACPVAFGEIGVKERVKGIINYKKPAVWIVMLAIVGCIVMAVCFLTNPLKAETSATQDTTAQEQPTELVLAEGKNGDDAVLVTADTAEAAVQTKAESGDAAANSEVAFKGDIDANGQEDYIYVNQLSEEEMSDDHVIDWSLELNGQTIYQSSHALICDFDATSLDLDEDGSPEIFVTIMPHVNSMPLEEFVTLKQTGDTWTELQNTTDFGQADENGDLCNAFPVKVTVGDNPDTLNLNLEGQKTITINVKKHYENMKENEQGTDLYTLADDFLNGDVYKSGDVFGTTSDWGLWDIECSKLKGSDCIRVGLGIQSLKGGKLDILGTMDIYFDYDENGQIRVLKSDFSQMQD